MLSTTPYCFILASFLVLGVSAATSGNKLITSDVPTIPDSNGIIIGSMSSGCLSPPTMYLNMSDNSPEHHRAKKENRNENQVSLTKNPSNETESNSTLTKNKRQIEKETENLHEETSTKKGFDELNFNEKISLSTESQSTDGTPATIVSTPEKMKYNFENISWPIVPGPIACNLDYPLQPTFVTKLGEFDFVVSIQRQTSSEEPAKHMCTGVIYNQRFVIIALHCLKDNYGLMVTSTDDLCTIDEMIEVDYIIEHTDYDPETRHNDIALLKLKSEMYKKAVEFPNQDDTAHDFFYAVGFGELLWKSYPDKVVTLLQKVPVERYTNETKKEEPGTLLVSTSRMDLTGVLRGDFGGALVGPHGEFIGLKSKLVKRSIEYEVYIKVQDYLPWIKDMVALHGT